jgi:hypothetical protein
VHSISSISIVNIDTPTRDYSSPSPNRSRSSSPASCRSGKPYGRDRPPVSTERPYSPSTDFVVPFVFESPNSPPLVDLLTAVSPDPPASSSFSRSPVLSVESVPNKRCPSRQNLNSHCHLKDPRQKIPLTPNTPKTHYTKSEKRRFHEKRDQNQRYPTKDKRHRYHQTGENHSHLDIVQSAGSSRKRYPPSGSKRLSGNLSDGRYNENLYTNDYQGNFQTSTQRLPDNRSQRVNQYHQYRQEPEQTRYYQRVSPFPTTRNSRLDNRLDNRQERQASHQYHQVDNRPLDQFFKTSKNNNRIPRAARRLQNREYQLNHYFPRRLNKQIIPDQDQDHQYQTIHPV